VAARKSLHDTLTLEGSVAAAILGFAKMDSQAVPRPSLARSTITVNRQRSDHRCKSPGSSCATRW